MKMNIKRNRRPVKASTKSHKRPVKAAESYGWVVDENEAWEAYEFACDYLMDKADLDAEIVDGLSVDELASSLAFIFRMNDFREWEERNSEDIEESTRIKGKRSVKASTGGSYIDQNARFELFDGFKVDVWEDVDSDVYDPIMLVMDEPWNYNGDFACCTYTKDLRRCSHGPVSYEFLEQDAKLVDRAKAMEVIKSYVADAETEDPDFYDAVYDEFK